jgi:hypothetical protein
MDTFDKSARLIKVRLENVIAASEAYREFVRLHFTATSYGLL